MNKQILKSILFFLLLTLVSILLSFGLGFSFMYLAAYALITLLSAYIAFTFAKLYYKTGRMIGLGMVFSWSGTFGVQGWWLMVNVTDAFEFFKEWQNLLFIPLSCYIVGSFIHINAFKNEENGINSVSIPISLALTSALLIAAFSSPPELFESLFVD